MSKPEAANTAPMRRCPRWMRLLLIVSLALNLLVVGAVAGAWVGKDRHDLGTERGDPGYLPVARALDREDRRAVGRDIRREMRAFREATPSPRNTLDGLITALRAEPFDRAAAEASLATQRDILTRRQQIAQNALLERLEILSAPARAAYADRLEEALAHGDRRERSRD